METTGSIVRQLAEAALAQQANTIDIPAVISALVKHGAHQHVDPYVTLGVLVESIAHTLALSIPEQKQAETAKGVTHLLLDRLAAQGVIR